MLSPRPYLSSAVVGVPSKPQTLAKSTARRVARNCRVRFALSWHWLQVLHSSVSSQTQGVVFNQVCQPNASRLLGNLKVRWYTTPPWKAIWCVVTDSESHLKYLDISPHSPYVQIKHHEASGTQQIMQGTVMLMRHSEHAPVASTLVLVVYLTMNSCIIHHIAPLACRDPYMPQTSKPLSSLCAPFLALTLCTTGSGMHDRLTLQTCS